MANFAVDILQFVTNLSMLRTFKLLINDLKQAVKQTTNFFHRLQATVSTYYICYFLLNASSTTVFVTEVTTFNFLIVHQSPMTKTIIRMLYNDNLY